MAEIPYTPGFTEWQWVRGTTTPVAFRLTRNDVPIEFDDVRLTVHRKRGKELAFRASVSNGMIEISDPATGLLTFRPTAEQTRALTPSKDDQEAANTFELEVRHNGSEEVWLMGNIKAIGGINDDIDGDEVS